MTDRATHHRRLHNLLLMRKILSLREGSSPFTLLLDSVEQSAKPLINLYIQNAKISKTDVVFISFETLKRPPGVGVNIKGRRKSPAALQAEIAAACSQSKKNTLLIIDTLHPLASFPALNLPTFLSSLLTPFLSLVATYHHDIPLPPLSPYQPAPQTLLTYLATTILTAHSWSQALERKRAADRSCAEPAFGVAEERDGVVVGRGANSGEGMVLEMEHRRKSGRGVREWFFVPSSARIDSTTMTLTGSDQRETTTQQVTLLEDHPLWKPPSQGLGAPKEEEKEGVVVGGTFELGLTARQRVAREGVVLPYFDAQRDGGGAGEGGRILYQMGVEDDFDEEEDEI